MASGYDISSNVPYRLMKGRLGVYDKHSFDMNGSFTEQQMQEDRISKFLAGVKSANISLDGSTVQQIRDLLLQDKGEEVGIILNELDPSLTGVWE